MKMNRTKPEKLCDLGNALEARDKKIRTYLDAGNLRLRIIYASKIEYFYKAQPFKLDPLASYPADLCYLRGLIIEECRRIECSVVIEDPHLVMDGKFADILIEVNAL